MAAGPGRRGGAANDRSESGPGRPGSNLGRARLSVARLSPLTRGRHGGCGSGSSPGRRLPVRAAGSLRLPCWGHRSGPLGRAGLVRAGRRGHQAEFSEFVGGFAKPGDDSDGVRRTGRASTVTRFRCQQEGDSAPRNSVAPFLHDSSVP